MTSIAWSLVGVFLVASAPITERRATIVTIDGTSFTGAVVEVPGGFAVQTATGKVVVPFEKVRQVKDVKEVKDAPERRATITSIDGKSVSGALSELPGAFAVDTTNGRVVVPFEKVREVTELSSAPPPRRPVAPTSETVTQPTPEPEPPSEEHQTPEAGERPKRFFFGGGLSGAYVPPIDTPDSSGTWALGGELAMLVAFNERFGLIAFLNYTHGETESTATESVLTGAGGELWFGCYGVGATTGVGYAKFENKNGRGWGDDSLSVLLLASPARLRFGDAVPQRLYLDAGTIVFLSHVPELFARVGYSIFF